MIDDTARETALGYAKALHSRLMDESALLEDLLVYVQNVTLGITPHRPQRVALGSG